MTKQQNEKKTIQKKFPEGGGEWTYLRKMKKSNIKIYFTKKKFFFFQFLKKRKFKKNLTNFSIQISVATENS